MSPGPSPSVLHQLRFPRVSGDEPMNEIEELRSQVFSPRERG